MKQKGYFNYPEFTTKFGSVTLSALKKYQKSVGLRVTGTLEQVTRNKINSELKNTDNQSVSDSTKIKFTRHLKLFSTGEDVKQLQVFLKQKGYFNYPEFTTKFGSVTKKALTSYQKSAGLKATGMLDATTLTHLNNL